MVSQRPRAYRTPSTLTLLAMIMLGRYPQSGPAVYEGHSSVGWMQASRADTQLTAERELPPGRHQPGGEACTRQAAAGAPAPRALQEVHVLTKWAVRRPQPRTTSKNTEVSVFTNRHSCDQPLTSPADQTGIIYGINGRKQ